MLSAFEAKIPRYPKTCFVLGKPWPEFCMLQEQSGCWGRSVQPNMEHSARLVEMLHRWKAGDWTAFLEVMVFQRFFFGVFLNLSFCCFQPKGFEFLCWIHAIRWSCQKLERLHFGVLESTWRF